MQGVLCRISSISHSNFHNNLSAECWSLSVKTEKQKTTFTVCHGDILHSVFTNRVHRNCGSVGLCFPFVVTSSIQAVRKQPSTGYCNPHATRDRHSDDGLLIVCSGFADHSCCEARQKCWKIQNVEIVS